MSYGVIMAATLMLVPQLVAMPAGSTRLIVAAIVAFAVIIVLITSGSRSIRSWL